MLVAYLKKDTTVIFNIDNKEEVLTNKNRYSFYNDYYVGTFINNIHIKEVLNTLPIEQYYLEANNSYYPINKEIVDRLLISKEDENTNHIVAYIKNGFTIIFNINSLNEILAKTDRVTFYNKYYVGTFINSIHTKEVLDKMPVEQFHVEVQDKYYPISQSIADEIYDKLLKVALEVKEENERSITL